ncbi:MAG: hypothetical protein SFT91_01325 [Rickettsiaceae bacterium]|nr:hypothetical protein [Rickettsiaceae bacterium]
MTNILNVAESEYKNRIRSQNDEIISLIELAKKIITSAQLKPERVIESIEEDLFMYEKSSRNFEINIDPYPICFCALGTLLQGAKITFAKHQEEILIGDLEFASSLISQYDAKIKKPTTSLPNFLQTLLLQIISVATNARVGDVCKLSEYNIYNIDLSPNLQGIKSNSDSLEGMKNSRWISDSKGYLELISPSLGYFFGGSRYDDAYRNKILKQEDCSSSIAKWLGSEISFTTFDMLNHAPEILKYIKPINNQRKPKSGDIFCYEGHTGIVAEYIDEDTPFKVISYRRFMPFFEGLIWQEYEQVNKGKNVITEDFGMFAKEEKIAPYFGLNNDLKLDKDGKYSKNISKEIEYFEPLERG